MSEPESPDTSYEEAIALFYCRLREQNQELLDIIPEKYDLNLFKWVSRSNEALWSMLSKNDGSLWPLDIFLASQWYYKFHELGVDEYKELLWRKGNFIECVRRWEILISHVPSNDEKVILVLQGNNIREKILDLNLTRY